MWLWWWWIRKTNTRKEKNVSNHEHLQFNHNIDHHQHTQNAMCRALCGMIRTPCHRRSSQEAASMPIVVVVVVVVVVTWCGRDRWVERDGIWCGCGSGGFERQIHEKEQRQHITSISNSTTTSIITTHAKRHVPRSILNLAVLDLENLLLCCQISCTPSWSRSNYQ